MSNAKSFGDWVWLIIRWAGIFLYYTLGMVLIGATTGCLVFLILGPLFLKDETTWNIALYGLKTGTILSGIWAPGVAIVKCFMRGAKERKERKQP
ncbi:hypothetical protein [Puniceicoccus vermicola]|uniref:Uncharacterized protein n=1 Tax=Puniceicoccus vermicola TaxID=388746 RepID=A0A7X1AXW6_9BACT|nr:hypothetical protein [Puniceicoccus vermicola]MBC2601919.1 hypothetical protein [Puniceicoccus vermicola]